MSATDSPAAGHYAAARAKARFDLDGDGRSDRLYRSALTGKLTVILSKTGTSAPFSVGADDLDGSVAKEILPADSYPGTAGAKLLTLRSDGQLRLTTALSTTDTSKYTLWTGTGWQIYNKVLAPGDLTKDGRQDLLARTPGGTLYLYSGTGNADVYKGGPFKARVKVGDGWQAYDQLVGTNDLDGDTIADLVARTLSGDLYFYKGTGSATAPFKTRVKVGGGWNVYNQIIGTDDVNNDGKADLLARTYDGAFYKYLSTGGGKFAARTYDSGGGQNISHYINQGGVPDYGKHGLFAVDKGFTAFTYGTLANGKLTAARQYGPAGVYDQHWRLTYVSTLGENDKACLMESGPQNLYCDGVGDLSTSPAFYQYWESLSPGDVTGDGKGDVVGVNTKGELYVHPGLKDRGWPQVGAGVKAGTGFPYDKLAGAGDITGDGRPDLISRDGDRLYVHPGTGSATAPFAARVLIGAGWGAYAHLVTPGDMNGDGRADLLAVTPGGDAYRYAATGLTGTSTFAARVKIATGWAYDHIS
ncbi:VCBS repeat-containing protein [Streptomyces sp. NPDC089799]|uniref:FG-GAP repeat domain-containing protein n=1 Tax=Streptomyces sp. NPDC089799 TaxID=3155066 RepID=UPI0034125B48